MAVKITKSGPFFDQPNEKLAEAIHTGLLDIAIMGAVKVKEQLYPGHGRVTAFLRGRVGGSVVGNFQAQIDAGKVQFGKNVVYANWVEGISQRNKTSSFKGYFMFKNVYDWLSRNPKESREMIQNAIKEVYR